MLRLTFAVLLLVGGCSLERRPILAPRPDTGPIDGGMDAARLDADDAGPDAPDVPELDVPIDPDAPDAPLADVPMDVGTDVFDVPPDVPMDVGTDVFDVPPDVPPEDAGTDAGPPLRGCDAIYSSAPGYHLCVQRRTQCEFYTGDFSARSCNEICTDRGGTAVACYDNRIGSQCSRRVPVDCDTELFDQICVCTRIP